MGADNPDNDKKYNPPIPSMNRRKLLGVLGGGMTVGTAGCLGDDGAESTPSPEVRTVVETKTVEGEPEVETVVETKTVKVTEEEPTPTATPEPQLVEDTWTVTSQTLPEQADFDYHHGSGGDLNPPVGDQYHILTVTQLDGNFDMWVAPGFEVEFEHTDTHSIQRLHFPEGLTYANGDEITARSLWEKQALQFGFQKDPETGKVLTWDQLTNQERPGARILVDEYTLEIHRAGRRNPFILKRNGFSPGGQGTTIKTHPDMTRPFIEAFKDIDYSEGDEFPQEKYDQVRKDVAQEIGETIPIDEYAGTYETGPYQFTGWDETEYELQLRDDFYRADDYDIPKVSIQLGAEDLTQNLMDNAELATIGLSPDFEKQAPDAYDIVAERPSTNGLGLQLNQFNRHLQNRMVRRAIATMMNWPTIVENSIGGGHDKYNNGFADGFSEPKAGKEFLESLHDYPDGGDTGAAAEWMQKGGYEKNDNGIWVLRDDDGWNSDVVDQPVSLTIRIPGWIGSWNLFFFQVSQTMKDFGFEVEFNVEEGSTWFDNTVYSQERWDIIQSQNSGNYFQMATGGGFPSNITMAVKPDVDPDKVVDGWGNKRFGKDPDNPDYETWLGQYNEITIPREPGDLGSSTHPGGEDSGKTINLVAMWKKFNNTTDQETLNQLVRDWSQWWNYDMWHPVGGRYRDGYAMLTDKFEPPESTAKLFQGNAGHQFTNGFIGGRYE